MAVSRNTSCLPYRRSPARLRALPPKAPTFSRHRWPPGQCPPPPIESFPSAPLCRLTPCPRQNHRINRPATISTRGVASTTAVSQTRAASPRARQLRSPPRPPSAIVCTGSPMQLPPWRNSPQLHAPQSSPRQAPTRPGALRKLSHICLHNSSTMHHPIGQPKKAARHLCLTCRGLQAEHL